MKICIPRVEGRGAGLGNEMIVWAKAFLASRALGIGFTHPAWGLNQRGYASLFGTSKLDWMAHRIIAASLPTVTFSEADYRATGELDYGAAIATWAREVGLLKRSTFVLYAEGLWGGLACLRGATDFVRAQLYRGRNALQNLAEIAERTLPGKLVCAIHVRLGDFERERSADQYRGAFNAALPLEWYVNVARRLRSIAGDTLVFQLFSDAAPDALRSIIDEFDPVTTFDQEGAACSDLIAMASADLLVCSISSYSMWAAYLSGRPYIWFSPNLQSHGEYLSIWGHEPAQREEAGLTTRNLRAMEQERGADVALPRGLPVGMDGQLPEAFHEVVRVAAGMRATRSDLIQYGVVPRRIAERDS